MLDKWIKNKSEIGFIVALIMVVIAWQFDLFRNPQKEPIATIVIIILFCIAWFPFCFKDES